MDTVRFSDGKRAIFPKVKEIKRLHGGVAVYAAHASVRIDAEIGEKWRFRMKTSQQDQGGKEPKNNCADPGHIVGWCSYVTVGSEALNYPDLKLSESSLPPREGLWQKK
jgi:hypothetical protein